MPLRKNVDAVYKEFEDKGIFWRTRTRPGKHEDTWYKCCTDCAIVTKITHSSAHAIAFGKQSTKCRTCARKYVIDPGKYHIGKPSWNAGIYGEKSHTWRGGKTSQTDALRNRKEFKIFKKTVMEICNHRCVICDSTEKLEIDHIKPVCLYPELIYEISNGRILCHSCHIKTDTYGPKVRKLKRVSDVICN